MKKRILIIDDEVGFTKLLAMNLEETGPYEVEVQNDAKWATEAARRFKPDLILLDIIMPGVSGRAVAESLMADPLLRSTPFIYLTASVSREDAIAQGGTIDGHAALAKPVSVEEVAQAIEATLVEADAR